MLAVSQALATALRRVRGTASEGGSAMVEFVFLAVLLMVPLVYLVLVLARLQAGAYAVSVAAREAGRAYVSASLAEVAPARAEAASSLAFADQGFAGSGSITVRCDARACLEPDSRVHVRAAVSVPLPLVPAFLSDAVPLQIPVSAAHTVTVDRFRATP